MIKFTVAGIGPDGHFVIHGVEAGEMDALIDKLAKEGKHILDTRMER